MSRLEYDGHKVTSDHFLANGTARKFLILQKTNPHISKFISVVEKESHPETKRLKFTKVLPKKIDKSDPVSYVFSKKDSVLSDDEFRYKRILKWLINVEFDRECEKLHSKSTH